jgi:NADPH:quinone reductase-like Zn-dependent oxidoreductase
LRMKTPGAGAGGGLGSIAVAILAKLGYRVVASTGRAEELRDYLLALGPTSTASTHAHTGLVLTAGAEMRRDISI